jgi:hypothetical protein
MARVVVKRDVVKRERGWRCGGIFGFLCFVAGLWDLCGVERFPWSEDYDSIEAERN